MKVMREEKRERMIGKRVRLMRDLSKVEAQEALEMEIPIHLSSPKYELSMTLSQR